jgi:hypothetical protein
MYLLYVLDLPIPAIRAIIMPVQGDREQLPA